MTATAVLFLLLVLGVYVSVNHGDGGDMLDSFEVISELESPDAKAVAVLYEYRLAELSATGYSVWLQSADQATEGSGGEWPKGKPLFTAVNSATPPAFRWTSDGHIIVPPGKAVAVRTERSNECFWNGGDAEERQVLCVHSPLVTATEGNTP